MVRRGSVAPLTDPAELPSGFRAPSEQHRAGRAGLRPFVGWDGEGITYPGHVRQSYVLFGASTGDRIVKREGLSTRQCFDLLLDVERRNPSAVHVGFAIQYDVNMMFCDLSRAHLLRLYHTNVCRWEGYRIEWRPGKWLSLSRGDVSIRLFDVWGFFQGSFVKACTAFLGADDPELAGIIEGKAARSTFAWDELEPFIIPYWEAELRLLVRLMDSLRDDLSNAGLLPASWHGPGAVANVVFRQHNIRLAKGEIPDAVNRASQYAYFGGRFELFACGHHPDSVWQYDINSAYPSAIAGLPDLSRGSWRRAREFRPDSFGVWRVRYDSPHKPADQFVLPQPFPNRDEHGNVSYPPLSEGWYWSPEAALAPQFVLDGWVFDHDGSTPFSFVRDMYETRREWKAQGISAEKALKLALNSLYGKMAQRVGWTPENPVLPRWHQLEWAGFVTSMTRATLWRAVSLAKGCLIAVETDAVFSTAPLDLPISSDLGAWSETRYDAITYLQNGLYYGWQDGTVQEKYRGFDKGSLPADKVTAWLHSLDDGSPPSRLYGRTTRFIGMGLGLHTRAPWRSWQTTDRHVVLGGGGKRTHVAGLCSSCREGVPMAGGLHPLAIITAGGRSHPHSLPWLSDKEPELRAIDELERW